MMEKTDGLGSRKPPNREYFIDNIKRILQKGATVPVLRTREDKQISEQEATELMSRCLEVLRKEYIDRLLQARSTCEKRVSELTEIFAQQNNDLTKLEQQIKSIREKSQQCSQRRDELEEKQRALCENLERVSDALTGGETGELSAREEKMLKELEAMNEDASEAVYEVTQVKEKLASLSLDGWRDRKNMATPTKMHELAVKKRLEEQQHNIESLVRTVKSFQNLSH